MTKRKTTPAVDWDCIHPDYWEDIQRRTAAYAELNALPFNINHDPSPFWKTNG